MKVQNFGWNCTQEFEKRNHNSYVTDKIWPVSSEFRKRRKNFCWEVKICMGKTWRGCPTLSS